jgi:hypothetical protein
MSVMAVVSGKLAGLLGLTHASGTGRYVGGNPVGLYCVAAFLYSLFIAWGRCVRERTGDCDCADVAAAAVGLGRLAAPGVTCGRGDCAEQDWRREA